MEHYSYIFFGGPRSYTFPPFITVCHPPSDRSLIGASKRSKAIIFHVEKPTTTSRCRFFPSLGRDVYPEVVTEVLLRFGMTLLFGIFHYYFNLVEICQIVNLYKKIHLILGVFTAFTWFSVLHFAASKGSPAHNRVAQRVGKVETSTFPNFPFGKRSHDS